MKNNIYFIIGLVMLIAVVWIMTMVCIRQNDSQNESEISATAYFAENSLNYDYNVFVSNSNELR